MCNGQLIVTITLANLDIGVNLILAFDHNKFCFHIEKPITYKG